MSMLRTRSRRDDPVVIEAQPDEPEPFELESYPPDAPDAPDAPGSAPTVIEASDAPRFEEARLAAVAEAEVGAAALVDAATAIEAGDVTEPGAPVDPRLRARRVEVRRANARRRRRRRWITFAVLVVAIAIPVLVFSPLLSVRSMSVRGTRHLVPEQITQLSGIEAGDAMITIDPGAAADGIRQSHWVRRVSVDRRWPWSVDIVVSERRLAAVVAGSSGAKFLVADDGVVLEPAAVVPPRGAVTVLLSDVSVDANTQFDPSVTSSIALAGSLPSWLAPRVTATVIDPAGRITFTLDKGITLVFGMADDGERKLTAAQTLLGGAVVDKDICQVDVSVAGASTLRRTPDCA